MKKKRIPRDNGEIQRAADRIITETLENTIADANSKLTPTDLNNQTDKGIDFSFEIENRSNEKTIIKFNTQNKGTENINNNILKRKGEAPKGWLSYQIKKLRHISYWVEEINEPLIFLLCDINSEKVYWYPIQLDSKLIERFNRQKELNRDSIQVYIDPKNIVSKENMERILEDITKSKYDQNLKYQRKFFPINIPSDTFKEEFKTKSLIDALFDSFKLFKFIRVVPPHLITRQFPISVSTKKLSYINGTTLTTTNSDLFEVLKELIQKDNSNEKYNEKESYIFNFFLQNYIYKISNDKEGKREVLDLKKVFEEIKIEKCWICQFNNHNILDSYYIMHKNFDDLSASEKTQWIFINYKFGMYETILKNINSFLLKLNSKDTPGLRFLMIYTANSICRIAWTSSLSDEGIQIKEKIENYDLEHELDKARPGISNDLYHLFKLILSEKYIDRVFIQLQDKLDQVKRSRDIFQNGGWSSNNQSDLMQVHVARALAFIDHTPLLIDKYKRFKTIIHKLCEGLTYYIDPENFDARRQTVKIEYYFLNKIFEYGDSEKIKKILVNHSGGLLVAGQNGSSISQISTQLGKMYSSFHLIKEISILPNGKKNYEPYLMVRCRVENALVLMSYIQFPVEECRIVYDLILKDKLRDEGVIISEDLISEFFINNSSRFDLDQKIKFLSYIFENDSIAKYIYVGHALKLILPRKKDLGSYIDNPVQRIINKTSLSIKDRLVFLMEVYFYVKPNEKKEIKAEVKKFLDERFSAEVYYSSVINNILEDNLYFDDYRMFILSISDRPSFKKSMTGIEDVSNYEVNKFIHVCFKLNNKVPKEVVPNKIYYDWLLNIEGFDYSKFNALWILEFCPTLFIEKFSNCEPLKKAVKEYLTHNHNKTIQGLYFDHFESA